LVKIGFSLDPIARLKLIQSEYRAVLGNVYISPMSINAYYIEQNAHKQFKADDVSHEWFTTKFSSVVEYISNQQFSPLTKEEMDGYLFWRKEGDKEYISLDYKKDVLPILKKYKQSRVTVAKFLGITVDRCNSRLLHGHRDVLAFIVKRHVYDITDGELYSDTLRSYLDKD